MLKHSRYNHLAQVPGEEAWALINFFHGTVVKLDSAQKALFDIAPLLHENLHGNLPVIRVWRQGGLLGRREPRRGCPAARPRAAIPQ